MFVFRSLSSIAVIGLLCGGCDDFLGNDHCTEIAQSFKYECNYFDEEQCQKVEYCHLEQPTDCDIGTDDDAGSIDTNEDDGEKDGSADRACSKECVGELVDCEYLDQESCRQHEHCQWMKETI
jgi:hypothetical protein